MTRLALSGMAVMLASCLGWMILMMPASLLSQALATAFEHNGPAPSPAPAPSLHGAQGTLWQGQGHLRWPISDDSGLTADIRWQMDYRTLLSGRACFRIQLDGSSQPDIVAAGRVCLTPSGALTLEATEAEFPARLLGSRLGVDTEGHVLMLVEQMIWNNGWWQELEARGVWSAARLQGAGYPLLLDNVDFRLTQEGGQAAVLMTASNQQASVGIDLQSRWSPAREYVTEATVTLAKESPAELQQWAAMLANAGEQDGQWYFNWRGRW